MSFTNTDAMAVYMEGRLFDVVRLLETEAKTDFPVIRLLGRSHFALGNFLQAYELFDNLFDPGAEIRELPGEDREKSDPEAYKLYVFLQEFGLPQLAERYRAEGRYPLSGAAGGGGEDCLRRCRELAGRYEALSAGECAEGLALSELSLPPSGQPTREYLDSRHSLLCRLFDLVSDRPDIAQYVYNGNQEILRLRRELDEAEATKEEPPERDLMERGKRLWNYARKNREGVSASTENEAYDRFDYAQEMGEWNSSVSILVPQDAIIQIQLNLREFSQPEPPEALLRVLNEMNALLAVCAFYTFGRYVVGRIPYVVREKGHFNPAFAFELADQVCAVVKERFYDRINAAAGGAK